MGRTGCSTASGSLRSHILSPKLENSGRTQVCVHEVAPAGEKESAAIRASASEPRPAKSHGPLTGRPGPQVAEGAPPSSTTGSTPAQPVSLFGFDGEREAGAPRGRPRVREVSVEGLSGGNTGVLHLGGKVRLVTLGHSSQVASKPCCCPPFPLYTVRRGGFPQVG